MFHPLVIQIKTLPNVSLGMKAHIARSPVGIFAFDERGELLYFELCERDAEKAWQKMSSQLSKSFISALKGYEVEDNSEQGQNILRHRFRELAIEVEFAGDEKELNTFLQAFSLFISRKSATGSIGRDRLVIQASNALEELAKMQNTLFMRASEWFTLHYPETKLPHEKIVEAILSYGRRENWPAFGQSVGADLADNDEVVIKDFAKSALQVADQRKRLEQYVKQSVHEIAPNFSSLVDPLLAARLLAAAGSQEKLAKMSASTIQLMGAEKALFRHLRKQGKSPKFGLIFQSHWIQNAPEARRGKVARLLAAKLMMAARIDFYSKRDESEKLKRELKGEIEKETAGK